MNDMYGFEPNEENENMKEDKIINNSYNTGEIEHESFRGDIKIDPKIEKQYKEYSSENIIEHRTFEILNDRIYDMFINSAFHEKYKKPKRVDKKDMPKIFYYMKDRLDKENTFSTMEIFISIAEFFQINYKYLYNEISVVDKENIIKELNDKYKLENRIESRKLF